MRPGGIELLIGFVTNFFDTLGIGSYAQQTSLFKIFKLVPDELIPGTLNIGDTVPTFLEAFAFMAAVEVGAKTLILMIGASILGAWLGAGVVASLPKRKIQLGMGAALLAAAAFFLMSNLGLFPAGGAAQNLSGARLALGLGGNFILGALMTLGIGLYAPCMVLVSLLGMNPQAAFPIMMGSCAFLMPVASPQFMRKRRYSPGTALALALGGIPGVLIAAYIVKSLPLKILRWLVIAVVTYTAAAMIRSAAAGD
ncbi:MAG: sulfite exporter TauE/SafE family protein [Elusimicrobia bacterium]|nr:sulfite exporter TauE/SafE family protein [Elusimicrobiota bacterium]MDE2313332.1 sulfite exporter TauE/SafE family protein [Elusimicrobiota bacterium]